MATRKGTSKTKKEATAGPQAGAPPPPAAPPPAEPESAQGEADRVAFDARSAPEVYLPPDKSDLRPLVERMTRLARERYERERGSEQVISARTKSSGEVVRAMLGASSRFGKTRGDQGTGHGRLLYVGSGHESVAHRLVLEAAMGPCTLIELLPELARDDGEELVTVEALPQEWFGVFSWIYLPRSLEHSFDPSRAIRELARVLAPQGIVGAFLAVGPEEEPSRLSPLGLQGWMRMFKENGLTPVYCVAADNGNGLEAHIIATHPAQARLVGL